MCAYLDSVLRSLSSRLNGKVDVVEHMRSNSLHIDAIETSKICHLSILMPFRSNHSIYIEGPRNVSSLTCSVPIFTLSLLCDPIMVYAPQAYSYASQACPQRDEVSVAVTVQTIFAISLPVG